LPNILNFKKTSKQRKHSNHGKPFLPEIKHFAITKHPTSAWVAQQLREATPFGVQPEYLIHDNDSIFVSKDL
jgi:hypothetical protein